MVRLDSSWGRSGPRWLEVAAVMRQRRAHWGGRCTQVVQSPDRLNRFGMLWELYVSRNSILLLIQLPTASDDPRTARLRTGSSLYRRYPP